jgi:hypothetical protein
MRDLVAFGEGFDLTSPAAIDHVVNFAGSVMTNVGSAAMLQRLETLRAGRARNPATEVEQVALRLQRWGRRRSDEWAPCKSTARGGAFGGAPAPR